MTKYLTASLLLLAVVATGCGGDDGGASNAGADAGGSADAEAPSDAQNDATVYLEGSTGDAAPDADPDATCGATGIAIEAIPPDMLVIFDRSCSMRRLRNSNPGEFGYGPDDPNTRWAMARSALDTVMEKHQNRIRFGLMAFPEPQGGCGDLPKVHVAPAVSNGTMVLDTLDQFHPFDICPSGLQPYETPTGEALSAAIDASLFDPAVRDGYVLLMTDGGATCGATASGLGNLVQTLASMGAKTAVVGFGDVTGPEPTEMMNAMGEAGGMKAGPPWYWFAEDPSGLVAAMDSIVQDAVSCTFKLDETPPDPDKVYAYFDGKQVPADATDGWTYDSSGDTVTFHGTSCEALQSGDVKNVSVVFGCPDPGCMPAPEVCDGYDNDCDKEVDEEGCVQ